MFENNNVIYSKLSNYQLEDSRLLSFEIDAINHRCDIMLENVLLYGDKRINKNVDVDIGTIMIRFLNIQDLEMKVNIDTEKLDINRIYRWYMVGSTGNLNDFGLFILLRHRKFLLNLKYSDIEVQAL